MGRSTKNRPRIQGCHEPVFQGGDKHGRFALTFKFAGGTANSFVHENFLSEEIITKLLLSSGPATSRLASDVVLLVVLHLLVASLVAVRTVLAWPFCLRVFLALTFRFACFNQL